jgi:hypothetical protein
MELLTVKPVKYNNHIYFISEEKPKNFDQVLTEKYGAWEFMDETGKGSAPLPYWANNKTCKKIIASTDKTLGVPLISDIFVKEYQTNKISEIDIITDNTIPQINSNGYINVWTVR